MSFQPSPYRSPKWLLGGHLQTIYSKYQKLPQPHYRREYHLDSLAETQIAYDFVDASASDAPLVVLFHGLEGSSESHYARFLMSVVKRYGWHGVVAHFRGCGNTPNTASRYYHSGDSAEISHMLGLLAERYTQIYAVGVSLGGNALAKYLGEQQTEAQAQAAAIISAPLDLSASSKALAHGISRRLYVPYFMATLRPKIAQRHAQFPQARIEEAMSAHTLTDFDNAFTAPVHGFADAQDYYQQSSAKPYLKHIEIPTLILNAQNDPFVPAASLPTAQDVSPSVCLYQPKAGGHVGFPSKNNPLWLYHTICQFFQANNQAS